MVEQLSCTRAQTNSLTLLEKQYDDHGYLPDEVESSAWDHIRSCSEEICTLIHTLELNSRVVVSSKPDDLLISELVFSLKYEIYKLQNKIADGNIS